MKKLSALYNTLYHWYPPSQTVGSKNCRNWCLKVRACRIRLQHQLSAQRWADGINMWPNAVLTFNHYFGVQIVYWGFIWILKHDKNVFFKSEILTKIKTWSYGYTTKIDVISHSTYNIWRRNNIVGFFNQLSLFVCTLKQIFQKYLITDDSLFVREDLL